MLGNNVCFELKIKNYELKILDMTQSRALIFNFQFLILQFQTSFLFNL